MLMRAQGINCEVELHENHVVIRRRGLAGVIYGIGGEKTVPLASITSIQFGAAGRILPGFIRISVKGESGSVARERDPNFVQFPRSRRQEFLQLRDSIHEAINVPSLASLAAHHMRSRINNSPTQDQDSQYEHSAPRRLEATRSSGSDTDPLVVESSAREKATSDRTGASAFDDIPPWQPRSPTQWWHDLSGGGKMVLAVVVVVLVLVVTTSRTNHAAGPEPTVDYVDETGNAASPPNATEAPASVAEQPAPSASPSLADHVGKYPSDEVRGTSFWQQAAVFDLVGRVIQDPTMAKMILDGGVEGQVSQKGEWIRAYACMPHNCDALNWSVIIKSDGSAGAVCYHNDDDNRDGWYNGESVLTNDRNCMP